jgi:uncharacterized membrane protein HdeD (DUF308 family)
MEKLKDLRFIIGMFFGITGALLLVLAFALTSEKAFGKSLNLYAGAAMLVFGLAMLLVRKSSPK